MKQRNRTKKDRYGDLIRHEMFEQFKKGKRFGSVQEAVQSAKTVIFQTYRMGQKRV